MTPKTHDKYISIIMAVCEGLPHKTIATRYETSDRVISAAIVRLQKHYNAKTTPQLIATLFRRGVIN
jgi:DNA-binding NarL/FixJ family response regulator